MFVSPFVISKTDDRAVPAWRLNGVGTRDIAAILDGVAPSRAERSSGVTGHERKTLLAVAA